MIMSVMLKELNVPRDASLRSTCCRGKEGGGGEGRGELEKVQRSCAKKLNKNVVEKRRQNDDRPKRCLCEY
jgi:hypothetical protein